LLLTTRAGHEVVGRRKGGKPYGGEKGGGESREKRNLDITIKPLSNYPLRGEGREKVSGGGGGKQLHSIDKREGGGGRRHSFFSYCCGEKGKRGGGRGSQNIGGGGGKGGRDKRSVHFLFYLSRLHHRPRTLQKRGKGKKKGGGVIKEGKENCTSPKARSQARRGERRGRDSL